MLRKRISDERNRLIQKLILEKKGGASMAPGRPSFRMELSCGDHGHHDGLLTIDEGEEGDGGTETATN
jgi:hypothetical protein